MTVDRILEHIYITIAGSILGILLGLGFYLVISKLISRILRKQKVKTLLSLLIPWRTLFVGLLLINYFPFFIITRFGLGARSGIVSVAYVMFLITSVLALQLANNRSNALILRITPLLRTIGVCSIILTTHYGHWGGGGLGFYAYSQLSMLQIDSAWVVFWVICGIALFIDEFAALIEWFIHSRANTAIPQFENADITG